jgi:DNA replication protein DnaC
MSGPRGLFSSSERRWISPEEVAGIPKEFWDLTLDDVEPRDNPVNFNAVVEDVNEFTERRDVALRNGNGITICGTVGTGKTMLVSTIARQAMEIVGFNDVRQVEAHQLFESLKPKAASEEKDIFYRDYRFVEKPKDKYLAVRLLVIDDLGAEYHTDWAQVELDHIITTRHNKRLSTCITTNLLNADEFEETYGARIADRLFERNAWYTLDGPSYRGSRK